MENTNLKTNIPFFETVEKHEYSERYKDNIQNGVISFEQLLKFVDHD